MRKNITKTLALLLSAVMVLSCFAVAGTAATKDNVFQYASTGGYLALGDSIGKGCGATGSYKDRYGNPLDKCGGQYNDNDWRWVEGSYAAQIGEAVGCEAPEELTEDGGNFWPCTVGGMTTAAMLDLYGIDDGYSDTKLNYEYYDWALDYFGYEGSSVGAMGETFDPETDGTAGSIIDVTKEASLITIELGMCDVFYRAYRVIAKTSLQGGLDLSGLTIADVKDILTNSVDLLNEGYDNWVKGYPLLLQRVQELNPDATIVIVGAFNLVNQMTLLDQTMLPIGSLFSGITDKMNEQYKAWAKEYNVLYADISNCESLATQEDWSVLGKFLEDNNSFAGSHPAPAGYDYITRQILALLDTAPTEEPVAEKEPSDNIVIDLGRFTADTVTGVKVNGISVSDYEINGNILTVPYSGCTATTLRVEVKWTDNAEGFQSYNLTYLGEGKGYSASRQYGINDIKGLLLRPVELFKFLFKTILGLMGIGED